MSAVSVQPPSVTDVTELMHGLFGLAVKPAASKDAPLYSIAQFVDGAGDVVGLMACDLSSGCRLGAALTQVPAGRVDEAVAEGTLPDSLAENLDEVFNISVNLLTPPDGTRVVLRSVAHGPATEAFAALKQKLDATTKSEYSIDIARYGVCRLVIGS